MSKWVRRICVVVAFVSFVATACGPATQIDDNARSSANSEQRPSETTRLAPTAQPVDEDAKAAPQSVPPTLARTAEELGCTANQAPSTGLAERDGPLVVLGDSLGWEVAAALDPEGVVSTHYIQFVGARWLEEPAQHTALSNGIAAKMPGLVVVVMGFWDVSAPLGHVEEVTPESAAEISSTIYRQELRAFRQDLGDWPIAWLLPPPTDWPHVEDGLRRYSAEVQDLACEMGDIVVDPREVLGDEWRRDISSFRIRHNDGVHFCPLGASEVASHLLASVGWPEGDVFVPAPTPERFTNC